MTSLDAQTPLGRSPFVPIGFAILAAWTSGEFLAIHYLVHWTKRVGISVATFSGELAAHRVQFPDDVEGFKVRRLDRDCYVVRAREWGDGSADGNLAGLASALARVDGRHWTMDVRLGAGLVLFFVAGITVAIWLAINQPLSALGRVGLIAWSAFAIIGVFKLFSRTRLVYAIHSPSGFTRRLTCAATDARRAAEYRLSPAAAQRHT